MAERYSARPPIGPHFRSAIRVVHYSGRKPLARRHRDGQGPLRSSRWGWEHRMAVGDEAAGGLPELARWPATHGLVRARLLDRLRAHAQLTMIIAPAGYGKTTLLAQHASELPDPVAWLRADRLDTTPGRFVERLCRALVAAGALETFPEPRPDADTLDPALPVARVHIMIDDAHLLIGSAAERCVEDVLEQHPECSVALASRRAPNLNLGRVEVGMVTMVSADDLRFRSWEVERLFHEIVPGTAATRRHRRADPPGRRVGRLPSAVPSVHPVEVVGASQASRQGTGRRPALRPHVPGPDGDRRAGTATGRLPHPHLRVRGPHRRTVRRPARNRGLPGSARGAGATGDVHHLGGRRPHVPLPRGAPPAPGSGPVREPRRHRDPHLVPPDRRAAGSAGGARRGGSGLPACRALGRGVPAAPQERREGDRGRSWCRVARPAFAAAGQRRSDG